MEQGDHSDKDYAAYLKALNLEQFKAETQHMSKQEISRWRDIRRKYNLTPSQYQKMLSSQNNLCLGCGRTHHKMCVDHDHKTGKVRGILCFDCNMGLGHLKDNPETLSNLIRYLKRHQKKHS